MDNEHAAFWAIIAVGAIWMLALSTISTTAALVFFFVFMIIAGWLHDRAYRFHAPRRRR